MNKILSPNNHYQSELSGVKKKHESVNMFGVRTEIVSTKKKKGSWDSVKCTVRVSLSGSFERISKFYETFFCVIKAEKVLRGEMKGLYEISL